MNTLIIFIVVIIAIIVSFLVYRFIAFKKVSRQTLQKRFERIKPLYDKLESGQTITQVDIYDFAKNLLTRELTFQYLRDCNKMELFPQEFYTIEKAAEGNLANWLEFPTELDACPDEMEHIKRITIDFDGQKNFVHYEVFKYRVNEPHWAAKEGWCLGVVGPYFDDSNPYDFPRSTFSRIGSTVDKVTPEDEAYWVHENISNKR